MESEILDFKLAEKGGTKLFDKDHKNLSKAISGFANSGGGILVWGVECNRDKKGVDQIVALPGLKDLKAFQSSVLTNYPGFTSPGAQGVDVKLIETSNDAGFLAMYIPKGESNPLMATAGDLHRYYYRSGPSFKPMPEWMVADRYGRRPQPKLELVWRKQRHAYGDSTVFIVQLGLRNVGRGLAQEICVQLKNIDIELNYTQLNNTWFWQSRPPVEPGYPEPLEPLWFNTDAYAILPDLVGVFTEISFKLFSLPERFISFEYVIICDGANKVTGAFKRTLNELLKAEEGQWFLANVELNSDSKTAKS